MESINRVSVIYAAGRGSRFEGLPDNISKCVYPIPINQKGDKYVTTLTATINSCLAIGIFDFIVVVGYAKDSVIKECERVVRTYGADKVHITYVTNSKWDYHGCEYSVELGIKSAIDKGFNQIYLIEGDTMIAPEYLRRLKEVPSKYNAMLVRPFKCIKPNRSVVAYNNSHDSIMPNKFWYDPLHESTNLPDIIDPEAFVVESGQVWRLRIDPFVSIINQNWLSNVNSSNEPNKEPGLTLLSRLTYFPVFVDPSDGLWNLNTKEDFDKMKEFLNIM